jgi:hypothetical protein
VRLVRHQVDTRPDVGVLAFSHEVDPERITAGGDAIDAAVVRTIESTVLQWKRKE